MVESRVARRAERRRSIQECACRLVERVGFDGFTMDDLAAAVGVSRRTLFNHVPDKLTAVLGDSLGGGPDPQARADFVAGGPSGALVADAVHLVRVSVGAVEAEHPGVAGHFFLVERAVAKDPKLALRMKHQVSDAGRDLAGVICERERWVDGDLRARVLAARVLSVVAVMLDEVIRRRGAASFSEVLDEILAADGELFGGAGGLRG